MSIDTPKIPDAIELTIKLRKCWVKNNKDKSWDERWNILGTTNCVESMNHKSIPDIDHVLWAVEWDQIRFDDPSAPKKMTIAEIEAALGYKIEIKEE